MCWLRKGWETLYELMLKLYLEFLHQPWITGMLPLIWEHCVGCFPFASQCHRCNITSQDIIPPCVGDTAQQTRPPSSGSMRTLSRLLPPTQPPCVHHFPAALPTSETTPHTSFTETGCLEKAAQQVFQPCSPLLFSFLAWRLSGFSSSTPEIKASCFSTAIIKRGGRWCWHGTISTPWHRFVRQLENRDSKIQRLFFSV